MKKFFLHLSKAVLPCLMAAYTALPTSAAGPARIEVEEQTLIYCVSASDNNRGVFTLPTSGSYDAVKISGDDSVTYSFNGSGGTFTNAETVYGTKSGYSSYYAGKATAAGNGNGAWGYSFWTYRWHDGNAYHNYPVTIVATDMVYDPTTEKIYGWFRSSDSIYSNWYFATYEGDDPAGVKVTPIGDENYTKIMAMAVDAEGTLWGLAAGTFGTTIYTIDKTTGALTSKGQIPYLLSYDNQSAAIDWKTGKLYWVAYGSTGGSLFEIDLTTFTATKVYEIPQGKIFNAFYIPYSLTSNDAPGEITDLAATFTGTGTDVKVTFTAPDKNFGGGDLTGQLTYNVLIDGEAPETDASGTIQAGAAFDKTYTMTKGDHTVTVTVSNDDGTSPSASVDVYAGFDTPKAVTGINVVTEGDKVVISWNAPEGVKGGILDTENLSYTVTRSPGDVVVAEKTKDLSVTEDIPDAFVAGYTYTVTVYDGETEGSAATSAMIMLGKPYTIPYTQNFEGGESLEALGFVSNSTDSRLTPWTLEKWDNKAGMAAVVECRYYYPHTYTLYTPLTEYKAGAEYTMKFKIACSTSFRNNDDLYKLRFTLNLCTKQSNAPEDIVEGQEKKLEFFAEEQDVNLFNEYTFTFEVPEDGVYSVCISDTESYYQGPNYELAIDDIEITGIYPTPEPVSDLEATPVAEGSRDIKLSFLLPDKTTNGKDLTSISKVEIMARGEVIATIDNAELLVPGNTVDYTVTDMPRGFCAYTVIVYNGEYVSEPGAPATAFSGYMNNLKIVATSFPEYIAIDGKGVVEIEVMNDAMETAAGYTVELIEATPEGGRSVQKLEGVQLASDETHTYTFDIEWSEFAPETVTYGVAVVFESDQDNSDNTTEDFTVTYEQKPEDGIGTIVADGAVISAANGVLTVKGNAVVAVYDLEGHKLAGVKVNGLWTKHLESGIYLVTVDNKSFKVAL